MPEVKMGKGLERPAGFGQKVSEIKHILYHQKV